MSTTTGTFTEPTLKVPFGDSPRLRSAINEAKSAMSFSGQVKRYLDQIVELGRSTAELALHPSRWLPTLQRAVPEWKNAFGSLLGRNR